MNYLQLCQRAAIECGVASGSSIVTALPTVVGATGSLGRIVGWTSDNWNTVQSYHEDWDFLRSSALLGAGISFQTIAGQASYPLGIGPGTVGVAVDDFGKWTEGTFRDQTTTTGYLNEVPLQDIDYDDWRDSYMLGAMRSVKARPFVIATGPDQSLCLGPPPDDFYTITGDFYRAPTEMMVDTDVPIGLPVRYHMLLVYATMIDYGQFEAAGEVLARGQREYTTMFAELQSIRAPRISFGRPL